MKNAVFILLSLLIVSACHKRTPAPPVDICPKHFVGMGQHGTNSALWLYEIDSVYTGPKDHYFETSNYEYGYETYDSKQKLYYIFSWHNDSINLLKYSFADKQLKKIRYLASNNITPHNSDGLLLCDGAANRIYCVLKPLRFDSVERICEIAITGDYCAPRTVYYASPGEPITTPVINEHNGCIYFITGSRFIKVDPITNNATTVTIFSKVRPSSLIFSESDGMFYGVDSSSVPNNFIRVNPAQGEITILAAMPYANSIRDLIGMFDNCRNCYVASCYDAKGDRNVYYIDIKNGSKIKEYYNTIFKPKFCITD